MKKMQLLTLALIISGLTSCRNDKKEQEELNRTLDQVEAVENDLDNTVEEVDRKAEEVKDALKELDSI